VGLVAVVRFHDDAAFAADPESAYIRIVITDLPVYLRGLMFAAFTAAYMSTIGTQLNWGASYIVNDVYRRFMVKDRNEKHYVKISQAVTMLLMLLSIIVTFYMDSIAEAWKILMALSAGTGLVFILRWFWWRINAWSEISAMIGAFIISIVLQNVFHFDESHPREFAWLLLLTVAFTTVVWLTVTMLTRPEPKDVLLAFYRRVRPNPALWGPVASEATDVAPQHDGIFNLINWVCGVGMIYCFLFGVGKIILGSPITGILLVAAGCILGLIIYVHISRRGWEFIAN
jgi:Na+/proline symporter